MLVDGGERQADDIGDFLEGGFRPDAQSNDFTLDRRQGGKRALHVDSVQTGRMRRLGEHFGPNVASLPIPRLTPPAGFHGIERRMANTREKPRFGVLRSDGLDGESHENFLNKVLSDLGAHPLARIKHKMRRVRIEPVGELCGRDRCHATCQLLHKRDDAGGVIFRGVVILPRQPHVTYDKDGGFRMHHERENHHVSRFAPCSVANWG